MISTQILLGLYGKVKGKKVVDVERPSMFNPSITVVIPCRNESKRLPYALASLARQTYKIDRVIIIDDGSPDDTFEIGKLMRELLNLNIEIIRNGHISIGKTPSIRKAIGMCTTDKIFVLDADTILEDDYIEKMIAPHLDNRVACSYGIVRPLSGDIKKNIYNQTLETLLHEEIRQKQELSSAFVHKFSKKVINNYKENLKFSNMLKYYLYEYPVIKYREAIYADQYFIRESQKRIFNTTLFPVGCGVLYDREKLKAVFDKYKTTLGDNLTTSEDIFVGFEFCNAGMINYQVRNAYMWTAEPKITRLPFQLVLWNSSFIQSAFYFKDMSKRLIGNKEKRPIGLTILPPIVEKVSYPLVLIIMGVIAYKWAIITIGIEFLTFFGIYYFVTPKKERKGLASSLIIAEPIRLLAIPIDFYVLYNFCVDLIKGNRNWRK